MQRIQLKFFLITGLVLMSGIIIGYWLNSYVEREKVFNQGLEQGKREIEEKYRSKINELYPEPAETEIVLAILGIIKEIKNDSLIVEVMGAENPFVEQEIELKTILIAENTELIKGSAKTREETESEIAAIEKAKREKTAIPPFELFKKEKDILLSDLNIGDVLNISAEENINGKAEFAAKRIVLLMSQSNQE